MLKVIKSQIRTFHTGQSTMAQMLNIDAILSETNKRECIKKFQSMPKIKLRIGEPDRFAAVLVPLCVVNDELCLLYTLRSSNLSRHVGETSFPGGMKDNTDKDLIDCALRETEEEIGIKRDDIDVWGEGRILIPRKGPAIMPVIGVIKNFRKEMLNLNTHEVEKVFYAPISLLISPECARYTQFREGYSIPTYVKAEEKIWGITAVITHMFLLSLLPQNIYSHKVPYLKQYKL